MDEYRDTRPPQKKSGWGCCGIFLWLIILIAVIVGGKLLYEKISDKADANETAYESTYEESSESTESSVEQEEESSGNVIEKIIDDLIPGVSIDNIKSRFGYGDETIVVDMSDGDTDENVQRVEDVLRSCPERILLWNNTFTGSAQDHRYMYGSFWIENMQYGNTTVDDVPIGILEPIYYTTDQNEISQMQAEIDASAGEILAGIPEDADYWTQCKVIHDALVLKDTYDDSLSKAHIYDIYGALVTGDAVCQGYAYAFSYLMGLLGHDARTVVSDVHAWNKLEDSLNTEDVYIDVTWDDMDSQSSNGTEYIIYDNFCITKDEMQNVEGHELSSDSEEEDAVIENPESYNYHIRNGFALDTYSYDAVMNIFAAQDSSDGNVSTVRFLNDDAWQQAQVLLENSGESLVNCYCDATGNYGTCYFWVDEDMKVINIARY